MDADYNHLVRYCSAEAPIDQQYMARSKRGPIEQAQGGAQIQKLSLAYYAKRSNKISKKKVWAIRYFYFS